MKRLNTYIAAIAMLGSISFGTYASEASINETDNNINPQISQSIQNEKVIVGNDTVSMIIPEKNYARYDRGLRAIFSQNIEYIFNRISINSF